MFPTIFKRNAERKAEKLALRSAFYDALAQVPTAFSAYDYEDFKNMGKIMNVLAAKHLFTGGVINYTKNYYLVMNFNYAVSRRVATFNPQLAIFESMLATEALKMDLVEMCLRLKNNENNFKLISFKTA